MFQMHVSDVQVDLVGRPVEIKGAGTESAEGTSTSPHPGGENVSVISLNAGERGDGAVGGQLWIRADHSTLNELANVIQGFVPNEPPVE